MNWLGSPFPIVEVGHALDKLNVVFDKIPTIVVDSGFAWDTVISSLIAGCIPAWIAWKTIKSNNQLHTSQFVMASKLKQIDEIRLEAANYIAETEMLISHVDNILHKAQGEFDNVTFEERVSIKDTNIRIQRSRTNIELLLGVDNDMAAKIISCMTELEVNANEAFSNYKEKYLDKSISFESDLSSIKALLREYVNKQLVAIYSFN
jgi:hypothetical protein